MPYEDQAYLLKPADVRAKIWRYMDFTKFISLMDKRELWFSRVSEFDDPFEGTLSKMSLYLDPVVAGQSTEYDRAVDIFRETKKKWRKWIVANCWHLNEYESAAMWKLYIKGDCGVAIQSTFDRFSRSFEGYPNKSVYLGQVRYEDYDIVKMSVNFPPLVCTYKRKSFQHEQELRALIIGLEKGGDLKAEPSFKGLSIPVDLDTLIERIFVSPQLGEWAHDLVKSVMSKYCLDKKVEHSSLDDVPL